MGLFPVLFLAAVTAPPAGLALPPSSKVVFAKATARIVSGVRVTAPGVTRDGALLPSGLRSLRDPATGLWLRVIDFQ